MVFAGHDTTASSVGWTLLFLGMHPEKKTKVHKEIIDAFGRNGSISYEALNALPYFDCCVKEVMRLRPASPAMFRVANKDVILEWVDKDGVLRKHGISKGAEW